MFTFLRPILRKILSWLTKWALSKHRPKIIAVIGSGETSIAREMIFTVTNAVYPANRNLETPEAEFSVPLTVLGYRQYPQNAIEWWYTITKIILQLLTNRSHFHFIVIELDSVNREIQDYWTKLLRPQMIVVTGSNQKLVLPTRQIEIPAQPNLYQNYLRIAKAVGEYFQIDSEISEAVLSELQLPEARIRVLPGKNGSTVLDATHYYFPTSIKAVVDIVEDGTIVFTDNPRDLDYLKESQRELVINPPQFDPNQGDVVVLRGHRMKTNQKYQRYLN